MRRVLAASIPLIALIGCAPSQSGQRTGQGPDYSKYVFALYDEPGAGATTTLEPSFPMKLAVAEVGQLQPSTKLLAALNAEPNLFRRVEPVTGISNGDSYDDPYSTNGGARSTCDARHTDEPRLAMRRVERLARDTGMDYLLIVGATIDSQSNSTPLTGLTLTIIGSFVAPSERLTAQGQASAALIDLRSDRIVMTSSSSADDATQAPVAAEAGVQDQQMRSLRDTVYQRLGHQFVDDCHRHAGIPVLNSKQVSDNPSNQGGKQ
jgi:hypothetical protein